jgi:hypothetical protein
MILSNKSPIKNYVDNSLDNYALIAEPAWVFDKGTFSQAASQ